IGPAIFFPTPLRKPIARTPRSYRSVTLTPYFWPSSRIVSIRDSVVLGFFMLPHSRPLPVTREVSRSSIGLLRNPSPVSEHSRLAFAMIESVPVQWGRSAAAQVAQFSFLHAVPVPSRLSLLSSGVLARTQRPHPESETSVCPLAMLCRYFAARKRDQLPMTGTLRRSCATASAILPAD